MEHESQNTLDIIIDGFQSMMQQEIVIAPWLALNRGEQRLTDTLRKELRRFARELSVIHKTSKILWLTSVELTSEFREQAYLETLVSTAAYLSYIRLGTLVITEEMAYVSVSLLKQYLNDVGSSVLLSIYARVVTYLNTQLLWYYDRVPEGVFVSGNWHRPWIEHTLVNELEAAVEHGFMRRVKHARKVFVELTPAGEELYEACREDLERCGYIRQREQLMRAASFTDMDDYEKIVEHGNPETPRMRKALLTWSGITNGMKVLELGCGTGSLTLDSELYRLVGTHGTVVATDPSVGMLERAKLKRSKFNASNVKFQQASAESIPFPDNTFDAVTGMMFLHFTDIPKAFEEIRRVLKPGGTFVTLFSLEISRRDAFFIEWFEPIFRSGLVAQNTARMPNADLVPSIAGESFDKFECETQEWSVDLRDVEAIVRFLVEAGTMAELNELPIKARTELFQELVDRGYDVQAKYGPESMRIQQPAQWFKGVVMK